MKILLLIDALSPGGAETHVLTLANALIARGHSVTVLSDGGALERAEPNSDLRFLHPPAPFGSRICFALGNLSFLCRLQRAERFDVLHAHTRKTAFLLRLFAVLFRPRLSELAARLPYRKAALRRCLSPLLVVTCHAKFRPRWRKLSFWGERTVAVSRDLAHHLTDTFGVSEARIDVVENGVDTARFCPVKQALSDVIHIVFASRLDKDCSAGARLLLDLFADWKHRAAARGKELRLTLVGGGDCFDDLSRKAETVNRTLGKRDVVLPGAIGDVERVLNAADLFVGVSRAAMEAMCCGLPVILAGDEGFGGLLMPGEFDRLAEGNFCCRGESPLTKQGLDAAFDRWLGMSDGQRRELADALCRRSRARYDGDRMAEATEAVYRRATAARPPLRALVVGYAGCQNLGDDTILRRLIDRWQNRPAPLFPAAEDSPTLPVRLTLVATVRDPVVCRTAFSGIRLIRRGRPWTLWRAIGRADAVIFGGGCLLQTCSRHGRRSLAYYLALMLVARLRGRPFHLVANGIGPLRNGVCRLATRLVLSLAAGISVRDGRSRRLLLSLGIQADKVKEQSDPALSLSPPTEQECAAVAARLLNEQAKLAKKLLCVVPKAMPDAMLDRLCGELTLLWRTKGVYPLFLPFDQAADVPVCQRILSRVGVGQLIVTDDERTVLALFSHAGAVISGRLHGLILAFDAGVPAAALWAGGDDSKIIDFAKDAGQAIWPGEDGAVGFWRIFNRGDE